MGKWAQIEIWVERTDDDDVFDFNDEDHPVIQLTNRLADAAFGWSEEFGIDADVSGALNIDRPGWDE